MTRLCLVVDDSNTVRQIARRILEAHGWTVAEAANGQAALQICQAGLPDCVLLDWNMPVMDGIGFLRAACQAFAAALPPVVFCTTETDAALIGQALAEGAREYIMKPFDAAILIGKLQEIGFP